MVENLIADPRIAKIAKVFESKKYYNNKCFEELMAAVKGYYNEPCFKELVAKITKDFEREKTLSEFGMLSLLRDGDNNIQQAQDNVFAVWEQALKTLEYQVDLLRWSLLRVDQRANFAVFAIASNGLCVASEICWLLRGGYADGAIARQRTLTELVVIAGFMVFVGREIDKDIGKRWLASGYVAWFKLYDKIFKTLETKKAKAGLNPEEESYYNSRLNKYLYFKKKVEELSENSKYGPEFKKKYGWAQEALKKINEKRVAEGNDKVELGSAGIRKFTFHFLEPLHIRGNFAVHGGEEPTRALYPIGSDDGNAFTLGPTPYGIEYVIDDTSKLVRILASQVSFAFKNEDTVIASAVIKALDRQRPAEIVECKRKRELFFHNSTHSH
ncbi:MAG: hypothetical protein JW999_11000 [Methanotrichaceae archaeon]|nr:hypothetical protein [Methanotrichaceae archaeon]